jgi:hypothetical protein
MTFEPKDRGSSLPTVMGQKNCLKRTCSTASEKEGILHLAQVPQDALFVPVGENAPGDADGQKD